MIKQLPSYDKACKAIKGGKDPMAFLNLGILYDQGIGIEQNDTLAHYFRECRLILSVVDA